MLNLIVNEVNNDIDEIKTLLADGTIDQKEFEYRIKGTVLRSKYLYLRIKSVFEDLGSTSVMINFGGATVKITEWSMVHILNRHYAAAAKHYDSGKSFHGDENLRFFEDPTQLQHILEELGRHQRIESSNLDYLPFKLNGVLYAVRCKPLKGEKIPYIRLQTFYPITEPNELHQLQTDYDEVQLTPTLSGFFKK